MKYKVRWTETYETEVEGEEGLSDMEAYELVDFNNKNNYYEGLDDLEVKELEVEDDGE